MSKDAPTDRPPVRRPDIEVRGLAGRMGLEVYSLAKQLSEALGDEPFDWKRYVGKDLIENPAVGPILERIAGADEALGNRAVANDG